MTKITVQKHEHFTIISNTPFRDKNLSLKAMGLLGFMMSCSDDWDYSVEGLQEVLKDGKDSIRSGLNELEQFGYLKRVRSRNKGGTFGKIEYFVTDMPETLENAAFYPESENPTTVNPTTVNPATEKPTQRKTKARNNNIKNNNIINNNLSKAKEKEQIKEQIAYDSFSHTEKKTIDNLVGIMTEMYAIASTRDSVKIGQEEYPTPIILDKLNRITYAHIQYILDCFNKHTDPIRNIKAYLQKCILNAPDTIDAYYDAVVRTDMKHSFKKK